MKKGQRVCVIKNISPELDPGRYRGLCGIIVRKDKKYKNQFWVKMEERKINKRIKSPVSGITTIWHKEDLILKFA